ncbi:hypothetical protein QR46_0325 [Giardia duodenalis assemblage B]|uniref:Uncharacterized protein n=2 Tax=Giardia intestinalis TaxID=5741 RepID=A0A132NZW8_GIAIN|nr:hypothetical protein QR46_0325 [Giardia intestinalis assemblage B]
MSSKIRSNSSTMAAPSQTAQQKYKAPVFAVFPFSPPDTFSYPVPSLEACDPSIQRTVRYMEEAAKDPIVRVRKTKRKAKRGASVKKKPTGGK